MRFGKHGRTRGHEQRPEGCAESLREAVGRYNAAWNAHDLDAILAMHAPDLVFENHTASEWASGEEARGHIGSIFDT
jgi:ketosteroid isomerase-like protein